MSLESLTLTGVDIPLLINAIKNKLNMVRTLFVDVQIFLKSSVMVSADKLF